MFFQSCLPGFAGKFTDEDTYDDENDNSCNVRSVLKMDSSTGALRIPSYTQISRAEHCPLLKHAWAQDWGQVLKICSNQPWRTLHMTKYSGRTALHLATFDRRCPLAVASALLKANRHMIAVRDSNNYTPLHIVAFFSAATAIAQGTGMNASLNTAANSAETVIPSNQMGRNTNETTGNSGGTQQLEIPYINARNIVDAETEARNVVSLFCDTAIMVEQELTRARGTDRENEELPLLEGTSPLYLAAKKGAPVSILRILLETRSRTHWIAPSTGGEPYWYKSPQAAARVEFPFGPSFSSPLEVLLREDRLRSSMNASYYRNDAFLLGEEEDGNLLRRGRSQHNERRHSSSAAASRIAKSSTRARRSPLHPDEIKGNPQLIQAMRKVAIDRCREQSKFRKECGKAKTIAVNKSCICKFSNFSESQQRCLELWEKCIELLATAGGGGIPMLQNNGKDAHGKNSESSTSFVPYGILHACVCCKVPVPSLVEIALVLFPEQVSQRDTSCGFIPLHHVLRAKHKYSYATSNLLTILLQGRAISTARPCKSARKTHIHHQQSQPIGNTSRQSISTSNRMPKAPFLHHSTTFATKLCDRNGILASKRPNRHLESTVLTPFPCTIIDSFATKSIENHPIQDNNGPIPLIYAIRLGLPMNGVIDKLLEADSHESLRTIDPISRLPPFALVAMRVSPSTNDPNQDYGDLSKVDKLLHSKNEHGGKIATESPPQNMRNDQSSDIITMAIGSTINILSSGDGNGLSETHCAFSTPTSQSWSAHSRPNHDSTEYSYQLDDIYRLLLAHPQVLSQFVVD